MFNPFKKKDDFNLDEMSLPSLSDIGNNSSANSLPDLNNLPNSNDNSFDTTNNEINSNMSGSLGNPNEINSSMGNPTVNSNQEQTNPFADNLSSDNKFNALVNTTPTFSQNNQQLNQTDVIQTDIIKSKLESIEAKSQLTEVRLSTIEQKIEIIYQMLLNEISDDTKQKLNINNMMNSIRNK